MPQPKVDSAIIKIVPRKTLFLSKNLVPTFEKIVNAGFSHPRKQLINNLSKKLNFPREKIQEWLKSNNIKPTQRAESLSVEDWAKLSKSFEFLSF